MAQSELGEYRVQSELEDWKTRKKGSDKTPVGISELDRILHGGFQKDSLILLSGNAGCGKTILSTEFIFYGATKYGEKGVYVSFAEDSKAYYRNMSSLGIDMKSLEYRGLFKFLDMVTLKGENALKLITEMIIETVSELVAKRLVVDSFTALLQTLGEADSRIFLHSVLGKLVKSMGVTALLIGEMPYGKSEIGFGVEEFVADGVIILRRSRSGLAEKKEMEIIKMRGVPIDRSVFEYLIDEKYGGIQLIDIQERGQAPPKLAEKITTGIEGLDKMMYGGLQTGSITLIDGPTGIGKTTLSMHIMLENAKKGQKVLCMSFEEPESRIKELIERFGLDRKKLGDTLAVETYIPEALSPLRYYKVLEETIRSHEPNVLGIDSITSMRHALAGDDLWRFLRYLQLLVQRRGITTVLTSTQGITERTIQAGISTLADNILRMRYFEVKKEQGREIMVEKSRGSPHDKRFVPFQITQSGMVVHCQ